ncbi:MAG: chemotaxis protein [Gammaproteobacteria bacterium]|nr:chemotaxis protein [Gammaproteobacteria bacterium]MBU1656007.1 chemotaxis protein [Gammaproteobacteria bacterium]MBU1962215.1 chemotaxis protein [Gammaproteobacteria bacterium]
MYWDYLIAMTVIPLLLVGWQFVQWASHRFAKTHPEFGPPRKEGGGCGSSCGCHGGKCQKPD